MVHCWSVTICIIPRARNTDGTRKKHWTHFRSAEHSFFKYHEQKPVFSGAKWMKYSLFVSQVALDWPASSLLLSYSNQLAKSSRSCSSGLKGQLATGLLLEHMDSWSPGDARPEDREEGEARPVEYAGLDGWVCATASSWLDSQGVNASWRTPLENAAETASCSSSKSCSAWMYSIAPLKVSTWNKLFPLVMALPLRMVDQHYFFSLLFYHDQEIRISYLFSKLDSQQKVSLRYPKRLLQK